MTDKSGMACQGVAAEASHLAALAAQRLQDSIRGKRLDMTEIEAIVEMLWEAQNAGHLAYLRQNGSEAEYQTIGRNVLSRFRTPGGKWRGDVKKG